MMHSGQWPDFLTHPVVLITQLQVVTSNMGDITAHVEPLTLIISVEKYQQTVEILFSLFFCDICSHSKKKEYNLLLHFSIHRPSISSHCILKGQNCK